VRLTRIDGVDLNLFAFDYDLTFMVFFLSAEDEVYARYGQRNARNPDDLQSLEGLRYTMSSVLDMHRRKDKVYAPREKGPPKYARQLPGISRRGCLHCHQVKEALHEDLRRTGKWDRTLAWRYPLPDNLGLSLEVNRGNVVQRVAPGSPADRAGVKVGDTLRRMNGVPIHSVADAQFALDRAPAKGQIDLSWERKGKAQTKPVALPEGWRRSDITWRPSVQHLVPYFPLFGPDLTEAEKKSLGLPAKQLAFRLEATVHSWARAAGLRAGDVVVGINGKKFEGIEGIVFREDVGRAHLVGERITINVLREGKPMSFPATLRAR
jgi:predicted metalloprotease with PDZ domain